MTLTATPLSTSTEESANSQAEQQARLSRLGVDLSKYPAVTTQKPYQGIVSRQNRSIALPILKAMGMIALNKVPDPVMMTHILTTRCNYLCSFCSFADTLNAKTDDLSLDEIERVYATIGNNLNTIVYSGGETTLYKDLPQVIEAAYRLTPVKSAYIISNAWKPNLLLDITHQVMQRCPELHLTWSLSIEGPREHSNTERRTHAEHWDAWQNTIDTLEGLKVIRERFGYDQLDVQLCTVCTPDNHELLTDWYHTIKTELKPDKWNLNLLRKSVQMTDHDMASFADRRKSGSLEPFEETYINITEQVRRDVLSGELSFLYHTDNPMDGGMKSAVDLISQQANRNTITESPHQFTCKAAFTGGYIGSTGEVSGCEEFANNPLDRKSFGNVRDVDYDFQALWHGDKATEYRAMVGNAKECRGCTLESQRNYPAILMSPKSLASAAGLGWQITQAEKKAKNKTKKHAEK